MKKREKDGKKMGKEAIRYWKSAYDVIKINYFIVIRIWQYDKLNFCDKEKKRKRGKIDIRLILSFTTFNLSYCQNAFTNEIIQFGYGTVRSKTSSSRDDSLQNHFSNGTVHPGTVRSICKK